MLWHTKDFTQKDHKFLRVNVEFDHARKIRWSPDAKAFVICRETGNDLEVHRVNRKPEGGLAGVQSSMTFPQKHKSDIIGTGIASTGRFVLTCSADTQLVLWSVKGDVLATMETLQVTVYHAAVSPCGRFVATSGFTSDVKVWHVVFDKTNEFKEIARAFELKGHSAGVVSFAFNDDSSRMATVSKDNTWKLWDTNIEFEKGQEPYKLQSTSVNVVNGSALIAMSGDGRTVAVASGSSVRLYSASKSYTIEQEGPEVVCLAFDPFGKYILCGVDKHIRVFHNVIGYQVLIEELEEKRKATGNSQSLKDRIQTQIAEAKAALEAIGEKP